MVDEERTEIDEVGEAERTRVEGIAESLKVLLFRNSEASCRDPVRSHRRIFLLLFKNFSGGIVLLSSVSCFVGSQDATKSPEFSCLQGTASIFPGFTLQVLEWVSKEKRVRFLGVPATGLRGCILQLRVAFDSDRWGLAEGSRVPGSFRSRF